MTEYCIDFRGYCVVQAEDSEEALQKFYNNDCYDYVYDIEEVTRKRGIENDNRT